MKKKTLILLAFLIALVGAYFVFVHRWNGPDNEFHITDPKAVAKVKIERMNEGQSEENIVLEKDAADAWQVNGKYLASSAQITDFLKTLTDIRVKEPLSDKAQATALSLLKRNHLRVQIWDNADRILKDYLIGPTNSQQTANIFKMAFSDKCYLVSKPAMEGYVSIYYSTTESDWRDKGLWDIQGKDVKLVSVAYLNDSAGNSFRLQRLKDGWQVNGEAVDAGRVNAYLGLFQGKVNAESFAERQYPDMRDSLRKRSPEVRFSVETENGQPVSLQLFARPESPANFFAILNEGKELLTVQHYVIDPFLKGRGYFGKGS